MASGPRGGKTSVTLPVMTSADDAAWWADGMQPGECRADAEGAGWSRIEEVMRRNDDHRTCAGVVSALTPSRRVHVILRPGVVEENYGGQVEACLAVELRPRLDRLFQIGPQVDGWWTTDAPDGEQLHQLWLIERTLPDL